MKEKSTLGNEKEKTATKGLGFTVEKFKEQARITARDIIRDLEEAIDHGRMTYFTLTDTLCYYLEKSTNEMMIFKPEDVQNFSLKDVGLKEVHRALVKRAKKERVKRN